MSAPERVLVAARGGVASRLLQFYRSAGIETVAAFTMAHAEAPWLDEADFDAFVPGEDAEDPLAVPEKVVAAAMDAGCDALHPGVGSLAGSVGLYDVATRANLGVVGAPAEGILDLVDRPRLFARARALGVPVLPASESLSVTDDGIEAAAQLALPVCVQAAQGAAQQRVDAFGDLGAAVAAVRAAARRETGDASVFLRRAVGAGRRVRTTVVGDRHGARVHLGHVWEAGSVDEAGGGVPGRMYERLGALSLSLANAVGWVGVGSVCWFVAEDDSPWLLGFLPRLTEGFALIEAVQGVDLIETQYQVAMGGRLDWSQPMRVTDRHGMQLRGEPAHTMDPLTAVAATREEALERLRVTAAAAGISDIDALLA